MKSPSLVLFALALAMSWGGIAEASFGPARTALPLDIPDGHPGGVLSTISTSGCDTIEDLDVTLSIDHGWTGDLVVTLQSPSGTRVTLVDRPGLDGSAVGYGCRFAGLQVRLDDEAALDLEDQCEDDLGGTVPAIGGTLAPAEPLAAFDGELGSGIWVLQVSDWAEENSGTLVSWQLHFGCSSVDIDLHPVLQADRSRALPGDTVVFGLQITNNGTETATGVTAVYDLQDGLDALWSEPGALEQNGLITQRHGSLEPGQVKEAQLAVTIAEGSWGPRKVIVRVAGEQTDSTPGNNLAIAEFLVGPSGARHSYRDTGSTEVRP